uniref:Putative capsid protein n=1 Tax=viral metagenome TaxID=1070528 RepID=A0A6M3K638_9ZZZZ
MADTQSKIYAQAYASNIMQLAQQKYSKLLNTIYVKPNVRGKTFFQDQIGEWSMSVKGGRNVQTPNNDPTLSRRMGIMVDYHDNRMLDRGDELKSISDPRSAYTLAAAASLGRKIDDVIIDAMWNTAYYGETGSSSLTNSNIKLVTQAAITLADVVAVKKLLDDADVETEDRYMACTTAALSGLLNVEQATSADYNAVKALVRGEIDTWMGFKWIQSTRITAPTTSGCMFAYHKYGVCAAMAAQPVVRTDERSDLSYSWQVYYELNVGAVRLEENRVVRCTTAA